MNRCSICDVTDEDNPKAGIKLYEVPGWFTEFRCLECAGSIATCVEDLSIGDDEFEFQTKE